MPISCGDLASREGFAESSAIQVWGGNGIDEVVMSSACSDHDVAICYCFYSAKKKDLKEDGWNISATGESLAATFPQLDQRLMALLLNAEGIKTRRLYNNHEPYPSRVKGNCCLLGDAARPMHDASLHGYGRLRELFVSSSPQNMPASM